MAAVRSRSLLTRLLLACTFVITSVTAAQAACTGVVAGVVAGFLIESPGGVRIVTDYNDAIRAPVTPDIVTHPTHYGDSVEPGVKYILRGWDPAGGVATHRLEYRDVRIHNVPANVREFGRTRYNGNSIFVFEIADLCIAHLHHTLTQTHLAELGAIDVVMVPIDGVWTLNQNDMIEVLRQIGSKIIIPMHIFTQATLDGHTRQIFDKDRRSLCGAAGSEPYTRSHPLGVAERGAGRHFAGTIVRSNRPRWNFPGGVTIRERGI
jgi:L-ascorbate metabolism protein UlaG (beta-lactamase superfamily)